MADQELSHLRERVGPPETPKEVDVKLHDAVYNFGRAKYLGLDAHLGAICVVNGWLDKVKVSYDKNGNRTFKLPYIHEGDKIKLPDAHQLKELDKQAFEYWNKKHPLKKGNPAAPGGNDQDKDKEKDKTGNAGPGKDQPQGGNGEGAGAGKDGNAVLAAKKAAQDLQTNLMQKRGELDRSVGSVFGHGADAWENMFGHGSNAVRKSLDEKQNQIKAMGKYANEGKLDDFNKVHKLVTGADFDPTKKQTQVAIDNDLKEFRKHHTSSVENLTEMATFGANWALSACLGKAKGIGGHLKQLTAMMIGGGAAKMTFKGVEHGNLNTGAEDFGSGAVSGLSFFAGDKTAHGVYSKLGGKSLQRYLLRGALSGGAGGLISGAVEGPNLGYAHARNEGRSYTGIDAVRDMSIGAGAGAGSGALLGTAFGAWGYNFRPKTGLSQIGNATKNPNGPKGGKSSEAELGGKQAHEAKHGQSAEQAKQAHEAKQAKEAEQAKQAEEAQRAKEAAEAQAPHWASERLPQWDDYRVADGATWRELLDAYKRLSRYCHPTGCSQRAGINAMSPEYQAFVASPEYKANVRVFQQAQDAYSQIRKLWTIPGTQGAARDVAAENGAINVWNKLEAAIREMHAAQAAL